MERAKVIKDEIFDQNLHYLAVYIETKNSCLVLLSENEDKLGTMAIAIPKTKNSTASPLSSVLLGEKNTILTRTFAEYIASQKEKIAIVSIYLGNTNEVQAQSILRKLVEKIIQVEAKKERVTT